MESLPSRMPRLRLGSASLGRVDTLGWRAGACFDAYGLRVGVRTNAPALLERLPAHLPPGWRACRSAVVDRIFSLWVDPRRDGPPRPSRVYAGRRRRARTRDLGQAFAVLESEIRQAVAQDAARRTFVHAGVVGWRGRAILVPGRSRSGKTTLVAELVKAGAQYLSDEFAVLDGRGRVHPFAKPLSIRGPGGCDRHAQARRAEDLGGTCATGPLPVGLVILAQHRPGSSWQPEKLTPGRAVLEMLAHTVPADGREGDDMKPQARRDGLLVRELAEERLVYDKRQHRAHCLNRTAADVFRHADGTRTVSDLARLVAPGADPAAAEAAVHMALGRLDEAGLLEGGPPFPSRREFVRRVGLGAAILMPAVVSIIAPTPAEAAVSACIQQSQCSTNVGKPCYCNITPCDPTSACQPDGTCYTPLENGLPGQCP